MQSPRPDIRNWSARLPPSGAWRQGDDPGDRLFHDLTHRRPFALEGGNMLYQARICYETWGQLNADKDNAILVCHALTGDSKAAGEPGSDHAGGWWAGLIGPGRAIDTDRYFVVCANVLGGCQGSTGPASLNPETGEAYGIDFPPVTIRDMVRSQASLADELGIASWLTVIGGSMGGMQVIEWGLMYPDRVRSVIPVATTTAATPWQIAWSNVGRMAIGMDPQWQGGRYYDAGLGEGPHQGLALARAIALITYRNEMLYEQRFGRNLVDPSQIFGIWDRFQVESYLGYHGEKFVKRFDANSYIVLNRAMDTHDAARGRGNMVKAFSALRAPLLSFSISSDNLYHPRLQSELCDLARGAGVPVEYEILDSDQGHDGFLVETKALGPSISKFIDSVDP